MKTGKPMFSIALAWIGLLHVLVFFLYWLTNLFIIADVNQFLADLIGKNWNFVGLFFILAGIVGLWSIAQLVFRQLRRGGAAWVYGALATIYVVFFYGSFVALFLNDPVQAARLGQGVLYIRIFIDSLFLGWLAWLGRHFTGQNKRIGSRFVTGAILFLVWLIPVFWSPGNEYSGSLPKKPLLIAHRGAAVLAPENTLASMQKAAGLGVFGLETDIAISRDGTLFLMHDSTLERTTNVGVIYPARVKDKASDFSWEELSKLSAGEWFGTTDPFGSVESGQITHQQAEAYKIEPIPTFTQMLQVVHDNHLHFIYDLAIPPAGHPYSSQTLDICLDEINTAGVASQAWVLAAPDEIAHIRAVVPPATLAAGIDYRRPPKPGKLVADGYQVINSEYGLSAGMIREYKKSGLWVNLWTVDEPWQYSRLWLAGADSVTSNNAQILMALSRPVFALPLEEYLILWSILGLGAIFLAVFTTKRK